MIKFSCPHCEKDISAADEHAGKKGRCPGCKEVFTIPAPAAVKAAPAAARKTGPAVAPKPSGEVARPRRPAPPPEDEDEEAIAEAPRKSGGRKPRPVEDDEDLDEVQAANEDDYRDEDEEEEERPRKKKKKKRRGQYADCPNCGCRGDATAVGFTWWGGLIGPRLFSHVRCNRCGTCYNGKNGNYNTTRIAIYVGVGVALGLAIAIAGVIANV